MRGRYFTGCWEVTATEPLTAEQRASLMEVMEEGGYALVCPGVEAADKCWRWAVPAAFGDKGLLQGMHAAGITSIGMMDRAHDFALMPSDMRYSAGADSKTRPPKQVAWMFNMTMEQAAEVTLQERTVFEVTDAGLEVTWPAELVGSIDPDRQ